MFSTQNPQKVVEHCLPVPYDKESPSGEVDASGVEVMGMEDIHISMDICDLTSISIHIRKFM